MRAEISDQGTRDSPVGSSQKAEKYAKDFRFLRRPLWGQRVRCTRPVQSVALGPMAEQIGTLECRYPVSLSLFNLAVEAPGTFIRADGSTVCVGVAWDRLELVDCVASGTEASL